jgi:hypothetical protein
MLTIDESINILRADSCRHCHLYGGICENCLSDIILLLQKLKENIIRNMDTGYD